MQSTLLEKFRQRAGRRHPAPGNRVCAPQAAASRHAALRDGPAPGGGFPLMMAGCGRPVRVQKLHGAADTTRFLESLGFVEGSDVTLVCENGGSLIVDVKGARVAVARQMAAKIMVKG